MFYIFSPYLFKGQSMLSDVSNNMNDNLMKNNLIKLKLL